MGAFVEGVGTQCFDFVACKEKFGQMGIGELVAVDCLYCVVAEVQFGKVRKLVEHELIDLPVTCQ